MADGFRVLGWRGARNGAGPVAISYTIDPQTLAIRDIDGEVEALFGFSPRDWTRPEFCFETLHPDDLQAAREFRRLWENDPQSHEIQYRMIDARGDVRRVHRSVSVREDGRGGLDMRGVLVDVTPRLSSQDVPGAPTRLRAELQRIVTEELARPVRTIGDYGDLLGRHLSARCDDAGSDYAIGVREGIERLEAVLARMMRAVQQGDITLGELTDSLAAVRTLPADR